MPRILYYMLLLLTLSVIPYHAEEGDSEMVVMVEPEDLKAADGDEIEIECETLLENRTLVWITPGGESVVAGNDSRVFQDEDNTLHFHPVELNDTGTYTCVVVGEEHRNGTVELEVYVMPDYKREGFIVLAINGILIVIFFLCLIQSQIRLSKRKKKYKEMDRRREVEIQMMYPGDND